MDYADSRLESSFDQIQHSVRRQDARHHCRLHKIQDTIIDEEPELCGPKFLGRSVELNVLFSSLFFVSCQNCKLKTWMKRDALLDDQS
jgi:hypothetical protein